MNKQLNSSHLQSPIAVSSAPLFTMITQSFINRSARKSRVSSSKIKSCAIAQFPKQSRAKKRTLQSIHKSVYQTNTQSIAMSSFQLTRAQALNLENKTQQLLTRYLSFAQSTSASSTADELSLERNIERLLAKSQEVIEMLTKIADQDLSLPLSKLQQLQRQREVYQDQTRDFERIRSSIQDERNRINLLFSVRSDIDKHQQELDQFQDQDAYVQQEHERVEASHSVVDRLIADALNTRDIFSRQSSTLQNARLRITNSFASVPGINTLIKKINTRKKRDSLILAFVITFMIILLWFIS